VALTLSADAWRAVVAHVEAGYPYEVVGILGGKGARVSRAVPLQNVNVDRPATRYRVDGLALFRAEAALEAEGLDVVGSYHSHPDHPSVASEEDRDNALPQRSYLIVAVRDGRTTTQQSWRLRDDRSAMDEEPVTLEPA